MRRQMMDIFRIRMLWALAMIVALVAVAAPASAADEAAPETVRTPGPDLATLMLTWQRDPTTTMTVQFLHRVTDAADGRSPLPDPVEVRYRLDSAEGQSTASTTPMPLDPWPGAVIQRVELTGLEPDSQYVFSVGAAEAEFRFRTLPATLSRPVRFVTGGDLMHSPTWMKRTNAVLHQYNADFVVWGGDLAYADGSPEKVSRWEDWLAANTQTLIDRQGRILPIVVAIGNHEVQGSYCTEIEGYEQNDAWRRRIAPYFYQLFAFPNQPGYGTLDAGNYLSMILLDTDHTNPVIGEQTAWLEQQLRERADVPHVFPFYHVPGYTSTGKFDNAASQAVREHWSPLFERYGVRLAFEAHAHAYKRTKPIRDGKVDETGVVYLGDGCWGVNPREVHDPQTTWYLERAEAERHAIIVTIVDDMQHVQVMNTHNTRVHGGIMDEYFALPR